MVWVELRLPEVGKRTSDTRSNEKKIVRRRAHVRLCLCSTYLCNTLILFVSWKLWEKAGSLRIKRRILHRRGERKRFVNTFGVFETFLPMKCRLGKVNDCWVVQTCTLIVCYWCMYLCKWMNCIWDAVKIIRVGVPKCLKFQVFSCKRGYRSSGIWLRVTGKLVHNICICIYLHP